MKLQTKLLHIAAVCLALVTASMFSYAADSNPKYVPFQGRIHDDTGALNGIYTLKLSMYNTETGGKAIWTEEHKDVSVTYGYVNLLLGATTPFKITKDTVTTDIDFSKANFIGIQISKVSESGSASQFSNELLPRHRMVPSFHAIGADHAKTADVAKNAEKLNGEDSSYYASAGDVNKLKEGVFYINEQGEYIKVNPSGDPKFIPIVPEEGDEPVARFVTKEDFSKYSIQPKLLYNIDISGGGGLFPSDIDLSNIRNHIEDQAYELKKGTYYLHVNCGPDSHPSTRSFPNQIMTMHVLEDKNQLQNNPVNSQVHHVDTWGGINTPTNRDNVNIYVCNVNFDGNTFHPDGGVLGLNANNYAGAITLGPTFIRSIYYEPF